METVVIRRRTRTLSRRSELVRSSLEGGGRWIQVRLISEEKPRRKKSFGRLCIQLLGGCARLFWFFFLGGFLVKAAGFIAGENKESKKDFFYALECHKFLWYTGSVWKRNP